MNSQVCTLTERGQISMPASLRRKMHLKAGQKLKWENISDTEARIIIEPDFDADPLKALGFINGESRTTTDWMREIRAGE